MKPETPCKDIYIIWIKNDTRHKQCEHGKEKGKKDRSVGIKYLHMVNRFKEHLPNISVPGFVINNITTKMSAYKNISLLLRKLYSQLFFHSLNFELIV